MSSIGSSAAVRVTSRTSGTAVRNGSTCCADLNSAATCQSGLVVGRTLKSKLVRVERRALVG